MSRVSRKKNDFSPTFEKGFLVGKEESIVMKRILILMSYTAAIPFYEFQRQFRAFLCLKKPPCRRQGSLLTAKWICPIHAEPLQSHLAFFLSSFSFANNSFVSVSIGV